MGIESITKSKNKNSIHAATRQITNLIYSNMNKSQISGNTPSFPNSKKFEIDKVRLSDFSFTFSKCHIGDVVPADVLADNGEDPNSILHSAEINYKGFDAIDNVYCSYPNVFEIDSPKLDENWVKRVYMEQSIESAYELDEPDETLNYLQPEKVVERFESLYSLIYFKWGVYNLSFGKSIDELEAWAIENCNE